MISTSRSAARVPELDGLRGIAISLVVVYHSFYFDPGPNHHTSGFVRHAYVFLERFFAIGWTGVDLFFVLSGFLIGGILVDVIASPNYFKTFYARRFYRIVPIYYIWICLYLFVTALSAGFLIRARMAGVLFLFLQNFGLTYPTALAGAWFLPVWSLAVEEQFYLIAPLAIRLVSRRKLYVFLCAVIVAAPLLRLWVRSHFPPHGIETLSLAYTLMPCRADSLAVGILAALLWRNSIFRAWLDARPHFLCVITGLFLAGAIALAAKSPSLNSLPMQSIGYTWFAVFFALVMMWALAKPGGALAAMMRMYWLGEIGRVSYCVYLIHDAMRYGFAILIGKILPQAATWELVAGSALAAGASYLVARLSWAYFEHPLLTRGHDFKY